LERKHGEKSATVTGLQQRDRIARQSRIFLFAILAWPLPFR
jgi:hypothetical protein